MITMNGKLPQLLKIFSAICAFLMLAAVVFYFSDPNKGTLDKYQRVNLTTFLTNIKDKTIYNTSFHADDKVMYTTYDGKYYITHVPQSLQYKTISTLYKNSVKITYVPSKQPQARSKWMDILLDIIIFSAIIFFMRSQGGGVSNFMKSDNVRKVNVSNVRFKDIAGIDAVKREITEIVDFLKQPQKYMDIGANIPKGALLVGQPGTGKTLLAKATAGEAGVAFFSASGSDFVELFVGVGAARVRALFNEARKNAPSVIFIDEIDAIGQKRVSHMGSQEGNNTLAALLNEMDGLNNKELNTNMSSTVIVLAATNLAETLDTALLRPGRFDRHIHVPLPDMKGRKAILDLILSRIKIPHDLNTMTLAQYTINSSGADLTNLINEALFEVVRNKDTVLTQKHVEEALERISFGVGTDKKYELYEQLTTAYHEVGHAILAYEFRHINHPIFKITIVNHGDVLGFVARRPDKEAVSRSKEQYLSDIAISLGGRGAEEIFFGKDKVTSGARSDFQYATELATSMVSFWGMSEAGMFFMNENHQAYFSEDMKNNTYNMANRILNDTYTSVLEILEKRKAAMHQLVYFLMKYETLYLEDIENIMNGNFDFVGLNTSLQLEMNEAIPSADDMISI